MFPGIFLFLLPLVQSFYVPTSRLHTPHHSNLCKGLRYASDPVPTDRPLQETGTSFLPASTLERIEEGKPNPTEKAKLAKDPSSAWTDIYDFAAKIR